MNKLIYYVTFAVLLLLSSNCFSQQVVAAAGGSSSGISVQLSWTIGEPIIETYTGSSVILTQGFHQSKFTVTAIDPAVYPQLQLIVYPNPVSTYMKLEIIGDGLKGLSFYLYDIDGKTILNRKVESQSELIHMETYAPGTYLLSVFRDANQLLKTFKIVKN